MSAASARSAGSDPVVILGAGRQALETAGYCAELGLRVACFLEERPPAGGRDPAEYDAPILSLGEPPRPATELPMITAVGAPPVRRRLVARWPGTSSLTLVSDQAWLARDAEVGAGTTVAPRAALNRLVRVGAHVLVNVGAILSHDVEVGDFATVSPGCVVGGGVRIGADAFLGIGCTIRDHVTIGRGAVVGAGAVVVADVADGVTVVGVPARPHHR